MIISFSIENYRSFADEETFNLVACKRFAEGDDCHTVPIPSSNERVLRTAVIYGANGSGKSNFCRALSFLKNLALSGRPRSSGTGRDFFRFSEEPGKPTSFDLQFIVNDNVYRFGVKLDDQRVLEEWLVRVDGGREKELYERITDSDGNVVIEAKGLKTVNEKLKALATIGGPQNQTFLATIRATLDPHDYGKDLGFIFEWFEKTLTLIRPDEPFLPLGQLLTQDQEFLKFAGEFLRAASTGVNNLITIKKELTEDELRGLLPEKILSKVTEEMREDRTAVVQLDEGKEVLVEQAGENHYYLLTIQAAHEHQQGRKASLELSEESDGTRRLLHLIPALYHLKTRGGVYVIDEIDRSMHPMLTWKFLDFFLNHCGGEHRQLVVTTHESNLLDLALLRRDEIWFSEKDKRGATRLYSLADFKVRTDLAVRKHYMQGRFGAVPFLGKLDELLLEDAAK